MKKLFSTSFPALSLLLLVFISFEISNAQTPLTLPITKVVVEQGPGWGTYAKFYFEGPQLSFYAGHTDCQILPYALQHYPRGSTLSSSAQFYCGLGLMTNGVPTPTVFGNARYFEFQGLNISGPSMQVRAPFGRDFERDYIPVEITGSFKAYDRNSEYGTAKLIFTSTFRLRGRASVSLRLEPFVYGLYATRRFKYEFDQVVISDNEVVTDRSPDK